jgi:hypothetical protein
MDEKDILTGADINLSSILSDLRRPEEDSKLKGVSARTPVTEGRSSAQSGNCKESGPRESPPASRRRPKRDHRGKNYSLTWTVVERRRPAKLHLRHPVKDH